MRHLLVFVMVLVVTALIASPGFASQSQPDPSDFAAETALEIRLLPNSLLLVVHGQEGQDFGRHATLHRVYATLPAPADPGFSIQGVALTLYTAGGADGAVTYAVGTYALFYGDHLQEDGFPARLWEDPQEDGLNGNEIILEDGLASLSDWSQAADLAL